MMTNNDNFTGYDDLILKLSPCIQKIVLQLNRMVNELIDALLPNLLRLINYNLTVSEKEYAKNNCPRNLHLAVNSKKLRVVKKNVKRIRMQMYSRSDDL